MTEDLDLPHRRTAIATVRAMRQELAAIQQASKLLALYGLRPHPEVAHRQLMLASASWAIPQQCICCGATMFADCPIGDDMIPGPASVCGYCLERHDTHGDHPDELSWFGLDVDRTLGDPCPVCHQRARPGESDLYCGACGATRAQQQEARLPLPRTAR